jgi:hypothetical protein
MCKSTSNQSTKTSKRTVRQKSSLAISGSDSKKKAKSGKLKYVDLGYSGVLVNKTEKTFFLLPGSKITNTTPRYKCWVGGCLRTLNEIEKLQESGGMAKHLQTIHELNFRKNTLHTGITVSDDLAVHMETCRRLSAADLKTVQLLAEELATSK